MSSLCGVCGREVPWHVCICGRECRGEDVLIGHIQRQRERAADRRLPEPSCVNDPHAFVRVQPTNLDRRERAHVDLDIADEGEGGSGGRCARCDAAFELDADVRRLHEEAHEAGKMWCTVCQIAFISKDSTVVRHQNSKTHARLARVRRAATLGAPLPAKRSRTLEQRAEHTKRTFLGAAAIESGGALSSDDDDDFGGGFRGDGGFGEPRSGGVAEPAGHAPPPPDGEDDAALLAQQEELDIEADSDVESDVAEEPSLASVSARASLFQSFVPAAPRSRGALDDANITTVVVPVADSNNSAPVCTDLTHQLVALANVNGWARGGCRQLFKLLRGHSVDVPATYESACVQAAARDASNHVRAEILSLDVPMKVSFPRADNDDRTSARVSFRAPAKVLVGAVLAAHRQMQQQQPQRQLALAECVRMPAPDERAAGAAAFAAYHNDGQPITDLSSLPSIAPANVWSSAAMFESLSAFSVPLGAPATRYVGVSVNFDGTFLYRKQQGSVLRLRFTSDETGRWHEIATWADDQFDVQHICEFILIPFLRQLGHGIRVRRGDDQVTLVGGLFDFALDKLAALELLLVTGKGSALLTPAAAQSAAFRAAPMCSAPDGSLCVGWRSHVRMRDEQLAAVAKPTVTAARSHAREHGMKLFEVRGNATPPFFTLPEVVQLLRSGLRVWACYLHQSPLGLVNHFLVRIARSLPKSTVLELNAHLRSMPRVHGVEHLNGDLFRFTASIKGEYYNASLCTSSGIQKLQYAYQLVPVLDHVGQVAFADVLALFLCADALMCAGKTADAVALLSNQLVAAIRRAPFSLPPAARFAGWQTADEQSVADMRVRYFTELPKWADWSLMLVANNYCGDLWWTTTAGAEYAHQETKDSFQRHSAFTVERGNLASLNRAERRVAAAGGWSAAMGVVAAARQRKFSARTSLSFVAAGSLAVAVGDMPRSLLSSVAAAMGDTACLVDARIGRLRVFDESRQSSFTVDASTRPRPTFLLVRGHSDAQPVIHELVRAWFVRYKAHASRNRCLEALFLQLQTHAPAPAGLGEGHARRSYDTLQPLGTETFVLSSDVRTAQQLFVVKHLLGQVILIALIAPDE